jgi:1-acyl-sn-glycerol-3-phosphate acyltransferase
MNAMIPTDASSADTPPAGGVPAGAAPGGPDGGEVTAAAGWELGPEVPQTSGWFLRWLGRFALARAGWRFEGAMPNLPKFVAIVAPHTSNWDFPVGLAVKWALGFDAHFWGKDSLFRGPLGWFMRANGGIPVDRSNSSHTVDVTVEAFRTHERFVLVLAPEGTRKKVTRWRSGFWHVAKGAGVPICCVAMDFGRKVIRLGPTTMPEEDDPEAGIARLKSYFVDARGYNPAQES